MRQRLLMLLIGCAGYAYVGYPILLLLMNRIRDKPVAKGPAQPTFSIIIPAHNEAQILPRKVASILNQDYPPDRVEVLVASDGSTDDSASVVAGNDRVRFLDYPRGGKAATLNRAAAEALHEIIIFTDANAILAPGTLHAIAANFADPQVGGVSANEQRDPSVTASPAGLGERLYWEYDKWVKQAESRIGSIVSASGSLYAIRRELFRPISDPSATDDFAISTQVVRGGYRLVFEPEAVTWEPPVAKDEIEFNRKVRIVTRGLRSVWGIRELLLPWRGGFYSVQLWSHKIVRRLVGFLATGIFLTNLSLVRRPFWRLVLAGQVAFYGLATLGWLGSGRRWARKPWFYLPYYFCLSNIAATLGIIQFLRQRRVTIWEPRRDS
ncbi:MAG TPA: glycosyltransferase family 2 protein [Thermomicrobiales bacterium]|nr:glycosyltransferase family 2 protein [Thermomicrobiales bacterium]